ncbi:hypothetical protein BD749_2498 [Pontibacter ramchanderi]|uniref:Uncharacterized protein n=1 Tax=Pontibacter ramchanderi TaxID=1179743 RepID=A0A2N3UDB0_9BACT|nr:hypothetical protein BD749_2498 [Pontibacter ramchanderi]
MLGLLPNIIKLRVQRPKSGIAFAGKPPIGALMRQRGLYQDKFIDIVRVDDAG